MLDFFWNACQKGEIPMVIIVLCELIFACIVFFLLRDAILYRDNGLPALDIGFAIFFLVLMFCLGYSAVAPGFSQQNERYADLSAQRQSLEVRLEEVGESDAASISDVVELYEDVKSFNASLDVIRNREDSFFTRYPGDTAIVNDIQPIDFSNTALAEKTIGGASK